MPKQPPKKSQTATASAKQADAVQMLKADHKRVKQLFERFHAAPADEQPLIARQLFIDLEIHTKLEEELFYPALGEKVKGAGAFDTPGQENGLDVVDEDEEDLEEDSIDGMDLDLENDEEDTDEELITVAYDEHQAAKELIEQLKAIDPKGSDYQDLFSELEEAVIEHITGEEDVLLPMAVSELDVQILGAKMQQRRNDLLSSLAA